jgi:hypothetical protein
MGRPAHRLGFRAAVIAAAITLTLCGGCLSVALGPPAYRYFVASRPDDAWSRKISQWQQREQAAEGDARQAERAAGRRRAEFIGAAEGERRQGPAKNEQHTPASVAGSGAGEDAAARDDHEKLRAKFADFLAERRRAQAREVADWIQDVAQDHYIADGPVDRWATLEETFRREGDDCDGLELLTYNLLRGLGFAEDEVFRAIVFRRSDGQHHMVTFWFENADDPWVIDPTGAMTSGMPRMSELPGWEPIKVFSKKRDFDVVARPAELHAAAR